MSQAARQIDAPPGPGRPGPVADTQVSSLLGALFAPVDAPADTSRRLTVLELGAALPETVDFFSARPCRLHFVDLYREPCVAGQADLSENELRQAFARALRFPAGTRLDVCLLWDFLSYLDDPAMRAFNAALRPWLHRGTRAHGFGMHHLAIRLRHCCFGIRDRETLSIRDRGGAQLRCHPHSQVEMQELFDCFAFERGLLLADGKLEMLLRSRQGEALA